MCRNQGDSTKTASIMGIRVPQRQKNSRFRTASRTWLEGPSSSARSSAARCCRYIRRLRNCRWHQQHVNSLTCVNGSGCMGVSDPSAAIHANAPSVGWNPKTTSAHSVYQKMSQLVHLVLALLHGQLGQLLLGLDLTLVLGELARLARLDHVGQQVWNRRQLLRPEHLQVRPALPRGDSSITKLTHSLRFQQCRSLRQQLYSNSVPMGRQKAQEALTVARHGRRRPGTPAQHAPIASASEHSTMEQSSTEE